MGDSATKSLAPPPAQPNNREMPPDGKPHAGSPGAAAGEEVRGRALAVERGVTIAVVVGLLLAAGAFLHVTVARSASLFRHGIDLVVAAVPDGGITAVEAAQQVYALALAHEIATFKAAALFIGAMITALGALFVLRRAQSGYDLRGGSSNWSAALSTSSPGLVMITLGAAVVVITIMSKVRAPPVSGNSPATSSSVYLEAADEMARRQEQQMEHGVGSTTDRPASRSADDYLKAADQLRKEAAEAAGGKP